MGGADKAFLPLRGTPLIEILCQHLRPQVAHLAISANGDPARFAAYDLPVLADAPAHLGLGPLAGIAAGLAWAAAQGAAALLTVPVDTPFIPGNLGELLAPAPAVACHTGRQHHLVALWQVDFLPALEHFLAQGGAARVRDALALAGARPVAFAGLDDPFINLNTPAALAKAGQARAG